MRAEPFKTLDRSLVTELIRPECQGSANLSLAEAEVLPGRSTLRHYHGRSEEVYYVLEGEGLLWVAGRSVPVRPGEAYLIRPGEEHSLTCFGTGPLRILCACAPPYRDEDTVVTEAMVG